MTRHSASTLSTAHASERATPCWPARRLKFLTKHIGSGKTPRGGAEVYVEAGVLLLRSQNVHNDGLRLQDVAFIDNVADEDLRASRVRQGDVLLNITGASLGRCSFVRDDIGRANVNQHVCIVRPLSSHLDAGFLHYAMLSDQLQSMIFASENGISREGLNFRQLGNLEVLLPPLDVQRAITTFLDRETARIDRLIATKEKLIGLLYEKRNAFIERSVSGVSTQLVKLLRALSQRPKNGISPPPGNAGEDVPTFSIAAVRNGSIDIANNLKVAAISLSDATQYLVRSGDILIVRGNANQSLVGTCGIVEDHPENCVYPDLLIRIVPRRNVNPRYLVMVINSGIVRSQVESIARTSNGTLKISGGDVCALQVPIPDPEVQAAILCEVDRESQKLDCLSNAVLRHIALLRSHRANLITSAVTGDIDVCNYRPEAPCQ